MIESQRLLQLLGIPSFADAYTPIVNLIPKDRRTLVFLKRIGGCGGLEGNYLAQAAIWDRLFEEHGPLFFVHHSQPTVLGVIWMMRNPEKVAGVINLAGVFDGTESWVRELGERLHIPCAKDFLPGSPFMVEFEKEYGVYRQTTNRPLVYNVAPRGDWVATHYRTCTLPTDEYTFNYVFAREEPQDCPGATWVPTKRDPGHFSILESGKLKRLILEALTGKVPEPGLPVIALPTANQSDQNVALAA